VFFGLIPVIIIRMSYIIVGLGNPGEEYADTRHNTGRMMLEAFRAAHKFPELVAKSKYSALVSEGEVGKESVLLIAPETFMNKSGSSLKPIAWNPKKAEKLVVIYDDLDLPLGKVKMSFNRGSGGHKGLESVTKAVKTPAFIRIRVGISPETPSGKLKKPSGDKIVGDFIVAPFKKAEEPILKKVAKQVTEALDLIISEPREIAMGKINSN